MNRVGQLLRAFVSLTNPKTGEIRDETPGSEKRGEFMERKESDEPFKGVAKEKDERRKGS
jgi:hypothetical protein